MQPDNSNPQSKEQTPVPDSTDNPENTPSAQIVQPTVIEPTPQIPQPSIVPAAPIATTNPEKPKSTSRDKAAGVVFGVIGVLGVIGATLSVMDFYNNSTRSTAVPPTTYFIVPLLFLYSSYYYLGGLNAQRIQRKLGGGSLIKKNYQKFHLIELLLAILIIGCVAYPLIWHAGHQKSGSDVVVTKGNPAYTASLNQFEASVKNVNLPNQILAQQINENPGSSHGPAQTCEKVDTTTSTGISSTDETCDVSYYRYFGSDAQDKVTLAQSIDEAIVQAGWQYKAPENNPAETEANAIQHVAGSNPTLNWGLNYIKGDYAISANLIQPNQMSYYTQKSTSQCASDAVCKAILQDHKYKTYFIISGELKQTF